MLGFYIGMRCNWLMMVVNLRILTLDYTSSAVDLRMILGRILFDKLFGTIGNALRSADYVIDLIRRIVRHAVLWI